jgi:membrane protein DedA with SNARE-associated domain
LKYSRRRFLLALGSARLIRYSLVAYLGSRYGRGIFHWVGHSYKPILLVLIALGFVAGGVVIWYVKKRKRIWKKQHKPGKEQQTKVA